MHGGDRPNSGGEDRPNGGGERGLGRRHRIELAVVVALLVTAGLAVAASTRADEVRPAEDVVAATNDPMWDATATVPYEAGGRRIPLEPALANGALDVELALTTPTSPRAWRGVGAALTDASATLLSGRTDALDLLFDPSVPGGAALDLVRLPLSATDFSTRRWTWDLRDDGVHVPPEAMAAIDVLEDVLARRPDLEVVGAAWTAPPELRSDPGSAGGRLVDVAAYGRLLTGQVAELRALGVPVSAVSLGNEPGVVTDAPSLAMSEQQMLELAGMVRPALDDAGVELHALDHNWSDAERAERLVAGGHFDAVAFHCYDGDSSAMAQLAIPTFVSECTATTGDWHSSVGWMARELVGDAVRAGSTGLLMWNLALDPQHGPKQPGGCEDCRGLLTVASTSITTTPEFSVLAHLSAAADPGARIMDAAPVARLPVAAFRNPDGSLGIFGHNDRPEPVSLAIRVDGDRTISLDVPSWAIFSVRA